VTQRVLLGPEAGLIAGGPIPTDTIGALLETEKLVNNLGEQNRRARDLGLDVDDYRCSQRQFQESVGEASESVIVNLFTMSFDDWKSAYTW